MLISLLNAPVPFILSVPGEHPYAQLQNVQKTETSQLNR